MNPTTDKALARQEDIVVKEMPGEVLVYDLRKHKAHCLNKTAAMVWSQCDGATTVTEMALHMSMELGASISDEIVWNALIALKKADLLEQGGSQHTGDIKITRRQALKKISVGSSIVLPLVLSVVAPVAATAATCGTVSPCSQGSPGNCNSSVAGMRANGCRCGSNNQCCSGKCSNVLGDGCGNICL